MTETPPALSTQSPTEPATATQPEAPRKGRAKPFTSDSARINAQKRWDAYRAAKDAPPIAQQPAQAIAEPQARDPYNTARLKRVRAQLDRIDAMMIDEIDPQKLDRLASAQAKLSEQERIMRGEPLPGSRRPAAEPSNRKPSLFGGSSAPDQTPQGGAAQEQE